MASDFNQCTFTGRLGRDPEARFLPNGDSVTNFTIACGESWKDKTTGEKKEVTEWIRLTAYRQLGEICAKYLKKGGQVLVQGKYKTKKWKDKEGNDRTSSEFVLDKMQMLGSPRDRDDGGGGGERTERTTSRASAPAQSGSEPGTAGNFEDSIPF